MGTESHPIVCSNCGEAGHVYRTCPHPVTSYGILCFRLVAGAANAVHPEYLMVQRKDSLGFVEFVRGKYHSNDHAYVGALLANMTGAERDKLLQACEAADGMGALWRYLWRDLSHPEPAAGDADPGGGKGGFARDFEDARAKFDRVKRLLPELLQQFPSEVRETEWGFPKGRRNMNESDMQCASREFQEETGLDPSELRLLQSEPGRYMHMEEMFQGSNGVWYRHVYFVAVANYGSSQDYQYCNGEIRSVSWFPFSTCASKIRPAYLQRRAVLEQVNACVLSSLLSANAVFSNPRGATPVTRRTASRQAPKSGGSNDRLFI